MTIFLNFAFLIDASGCAFGTRITTNVHYPRRPCGWWIYINPGFYICNHSDLCDPNIFWSGEAGSRCMCSRTLHSNWWICPRLRWKLQMVFRKKNHTLIYINFKIDLDSDLQKSITCMETLAQLGILHVAARHFHATRMQIQLSSWSDNTGAEGSTSKLFCTSKPLCCFVEKLCMFSALSGIEMDVHHVPGHDNQEADDLSRLDVETNCPTGFHLQDRVRLPLSTLWSKPTFTNACSSRYQDSLEVAYNMRILFSCWKSLIFIGGNCWRMISPDNFSWGENMDPSKQLGF